MTAKRVVIDANILIRAVLGRRVSDLFDEYRAEVEFCTPPLTFTEAERHLPAVAAKRDLDLGKILDSLSRLRRVVSIVSDDALLVRHDAALARIGQRDPNDWPLVAAALALDCPIWTEDRDFFGVGVATWTTATVEVYLRGE